MVRQERLGARSSTVKRLRRLLSKRDEREREGRFVVEGVRGVAAAFEAGATVEGLYLAPDASARCPELIDEAIGRGCPIQWFDPGVIERVADAVTPQPVLAVVTTPDVDLETVDADLIVVLAGLGDPGNAGTVVRSAEAAGASAVVFCRGSADPWSPKVVRATAGALFHVPVTRAGDAAEVLHVLGQRGVRRLGTVAHGGRPYDAVDWSAPLALVLGNEAHGLDAELAEAIDEWVTIPIAGHGDSLNVAMAASVLVFEAARARDEHRRSRPQVGDPAVGPDCTDVT